MTLSARQRLLRAPLLPLSRLLLRDLATEQPTTAADQPAALSYFALRRAALQGEEAANARATSSRFRAALENPPMIHPRESPDAAGTAAITQRDSGTLTFSREPTLRHNVAHRNTKSFSACAKTEDVVTSLWKVEENSAAIFLRCLSSDTFSMT